MGILQRFRGSKQIEPEVAVATALSTAEAVRSMPEIGGDPVKKRELVAIIETLKATKTGLETGKDPEGISVTAVELGERLQRTLGYMKGRGLWSRLTAGSDKSTKAELGRLEKELMAATKALRD